MGGVGGCVCLLLYCSLDQISKLFISKQFSYKEVFISFF